jgi:hypothetical protein
VYILGASNNPDKIECTVPFEIDEKEIFFGPCKKRLRQKLKKEIDTNGKLKTETYFIGLNSTNVKKERKIVWVGKIQSNYTFQQANEKLVGSKYLSIKTRRKTTRFPLHVTPTKNGYQLKSELHSENGKWILDIVSNRYFVKYNLNTSSLVLKDGCTFDRDICFMFSNIFFANRFESGIEIDNEILSVFKKSQLNKKKINSFAVFGYRKDNSIDGKTGGWLELDNQSTKTIVNLIKGKSKTIKKSRNSTYTKAPFQTIINNRGGCK